jgi:hypothetical protein
LRNSSSIGRAASSLAMSSGLKLTVKRQKAGGYAAVDASSGAVAVSLAASTAASSSSSSSVPSPSPSPPPAPPAAAGAKRRFKSILDYLCSLSSHTLTQLYRDPFTVLTIFRSLPPLAKQYALRLVCIADESSVGPGDGGLRVEKSLVDGWCRSELISQQAHHAAIMRLQELHIVIKINAAKSAVSDAPVPAYRLSHTFAAQLQRAVTNQSALHSCSQHRLGLILPQLIPVTILCASCLGLKGP